MAGHFLDPAYAFPNMIIPQGISADLIATKYGYSHEDLDSYALQSQVRAKQAWDAGYFSESVLPVKDVIGEALLAHDEHMRAQTTTESLQLPQTSVRRHRRRHAFHESRRTPEIPGLKKSITCTMRVIAPASSMARRRYSLETSEVERSWVLS